MAYLTILEADTILTGSPYEAEWNSLTDPQKQYGLDSATSLVDSFNYQGIKTDFTNSNQFPRFIFCYGTFEIPQDLLKAISIESVYISKVKEDSLVTELKQGIDSKSALSSSVSYNKQGHVDSIYVGLGFRSLEASKLVYKYIEKSGVY